MTSNDHRLEQDVRAMIEAGKPIEELTQADIPQIRALLHNYLGQYEASRQDAADGCGLNVSVISQFLNNQYPGDNLNVAKRAMDWMNIDLKDKTNPKITGYIKTKVTERTNASLDLASKTGKMVIMHGPAGCGKTIALKSYVYRRPTAMYVLVTTGYTTERGILKLISIVAGIRAKSTVSEMISDLANRLAGSKRIILIDQAHRLNVKALEAIRDLYDLTKCPIALVGTVKIIRTIDNGKREAEEWITDQFDSRVIERRDLMAVSNEDGGKKIFKPSDIQNAFDPDRKKITPDGARWLCDIANMEGNGCLRRVENILLYFDEKVKQGVMLTMQLAKAIYNHQTGGGPMPIEAEVYEERKAAAG